MTSSSKPFPFPPPALLALLLIGPACSPDVEVLPRDQQPLRPLIYTEYPDLTPQGAAVREERLVRQLLEDESDLGPAFSNSGERLQPLPLLDSPDELGRVIVEALLSRDRELFEHAFISPHAYTSLVRVDPRDAAEFVDNQIGSSTPLWTLFTQTLSSEMPEGGLGAILHYDGIELGRGRRADGGLTLGNEAPVQFWGNKIFLRLRDYDLRFELPIPRIFLVPNGSDTSGQENPVDPIHIYTLGSEIQSDRSFRTFLHSGMHLKPEIMRPTEYPFPLQIGNFWRYRRYDRNVGVEDIDPLEAGFTEKTDSDHSLAAREVVLEVLQLSQYRHVRLVELRRSYDDQHLTRVQEFWVLTPRQIFACSEECRAHIDDLAFLVHYFDNQIPLFTFPIRLGEGWHHGGRPDDDPTFHIDPDWHLIEPPAGYFPASYAIQGRGPLGWWDPYYQRSQITRFFQPGRGLVRLDITDRQNPLERVDVIEELVEYRLHH